MNKPLFDDTPSFDPHVVSIINLMLSKLRNNKPKPTSPVYMRNAYFIKELYDGTFLRHLFEYSNEEQYNLENVNLKVAACKGSWQITKRTISESLDHLELAKGKNYMPYNKKFIEAISFANFFEGSMRFNANGAFDSNFMKFINEPKMSYNHHTDIVINKIKSELPENILKYAEPFCNKHFKIKSMQLSFWYNMEDWSRWFKAFRKNYLKTSSEFLLACDDGNMFIDFSNYLMRKLKRKSGETASVNPYYFKLTMGDSTTLSGMFRDWLVDGIGSGKFAILKGLPKSIDSYYTDKSFEHKKVKIEKSVIDMDEIPIF